MEHESFIGYIGIIITIISSVFYLGRKFETFVSHDICSNRRDEESKYSEEKYVTKLECAKRHRGK